MKYRQEPDFTTPKPHDGPKNTKKIEPREEIIDRFLNMHELGTILRFLKFEDRVRMYMKDYLSDLSDEELKSILEKYRWDVDLYI